MKLAIDAFSQINVIEYEFLLVFIYLVDYPVFPHSVLPVTFQFTDESEPDIRVVGKFLDSTSYLKSQSWVKTPKTSEEDAQKNRSIAQEERTFRISSASRART